MIFWSTSLLKAQKVSPNMNGQQKKCHQIIIIEGEEENGCDPDGPRTWGTSCAIPSWNVPKSIFENGKMEKVSPNSEDNLNRTKKCHQIYIIVVWEKRKKSHQNWSDQEREREKKKCHQIWIIIMHLCSALQRKKIFKKNIFLKIRKKMIQSGEETGQRKEIRLLIN